MRLDFFFRYRLRPFAKRAARGWRYATNRLTRDDAQEMFHGIKEIAGWYTLEGLAVEDVAEAIEERFENGAALAERYADDAASRVGRKWSSDGELRSAAIDWAISLVKEYAAEDGVPVVPHADWEDAA